MNSRESHFHRGAVSGGFQASPFSAFHFLSNYNYILPPEGSDVPTKHLLSATRLFSEQSLPSSESETLVPALHSDPERFISIPQKPFAYWQQGSFLPNEFTDLTHRNSLMSSSCGTLFGNNFKRQRGEKKPIPEEQKDDKYFERRKRNNQAAKKSRDARKLREDQIALKAAILEHENAILRAQILSLRDEATTLRQLLMEKKVSKF